jgi:hypothetical protein
MPVYKKIPANRTKMTVVMLSIPVFYGNMPDLTTSAKNMSPGGKRARTRKGFVF